MSSAMFQLSVGRQVKMQPVLRKGDIRKCVEQALHEITYFAEDKQISISTNLEPEPGPLYFERAQIEQVLVNLLENACKFTPRAGEIEIQAYPFSWERRAVRNSRIRRMSDEAMTYRVSTRTASISETLVRPSPRSICRPFLKSIHLMRWGRTVQMEGWA